MNDIKPPKQLLVYGYYRARSEAGATNISKDWKNFRAMRIIYNFIFMLQFKYSRL